MADYKHTDYELIIKQMEALAEECPEHIPVMANVSALLYHSMEEINWQNQWNE